MTGVDDPYEIPLTPDLELNGAELSVARLVGAVSVFLVKKGLLRDRRRS